MPALLVVAGEASADFLAAETVQALIGQWEIYGIGGPRLQALGADLLCRAEALNLVGISEVFTALPRVASVFAALCERIAHGKPDVALLVDLPDFNLRLGPLLATLGIPVVYCGAPQAWAWRSYRAKAMARWVSSLACLFPFEAEFFCRRGVRAHFVGHPRAVQAARLLPSVHGDPHTILLLPGSRSAEIRRHMPLLIAAVQRLRDSAPHLSYLIPVAPTVTAHSLRAYLSPELPIAVSEDDALQVMSRGALALSACGTATTELMLMGVVPICFYLTSRLTFTIAKRLIRTPYVAMPNILADQALVPELIQSQATPANLVAHLQRFLEDQELRTHCQQRLAALGRTLLGPADGREPAERIAALVMAHAPLRTARRSTP